MLNMLIKNFYVIGGYCKGEEWGSTMKNRLSRQYSELLCDIVAVCDAIAPDDFLLNSLLGHSDDHNLETLLNYFENQLANSSNHITC